MSGGADLARRRLRDARGLRIVFVSHCLLNQNARYAGGASAPGCLPAAVSGLLGSGLGIVQMPCPEMKAWGGPWKWLIWLPYGQNAAVRVLARLAFPFFQGWTKAVFGHEARKIAREAAHWRRSGWETEAVVGVDGSPSCGVSTALDLRTCLDLHCDLGAATLDRDGYNRRLYAECLRAGRGLFIEALRIALLRKGIMPRYDAWNLMEELSVGD